MQLLNAALLLIVEQRWDFVDASFFMDVPKLAHLCLELLPCVCDHDDCGLYNNSSRGIFFADAWQGRVRDARGVPPAVAVVQACSNWLHECGYSRHTLINSKM
jgi:hypothetical protein